MNHPRTPYILRWSLATMVGWVAGAIMALPVILLYVFTPLRNSILVFLLVVVMLAVAGALVGWAQWALVLRHLLTDETDTEPSPTFPRWLAMSAVMGIAAPLTCAFTLRFPSALFVIESGGYRAVEFGSTWLINLIPIAIGVGVAVGLPQWYVLRHRIGNAHLWIYANMIAAAVSLVTFLAAVIIVQSDVLLVILSCCGLPALFGAVAGLGLYRLIATTTLS